jgi:hypothetical protein
VDGKFMLEPFKSFYGELLTEARTRDWPNGFSAETLSRWFREGLSAVPCGSKEVVRRFYDERTLTEWSGCGQSLIYVQFEICHYLNYLRQPLEWANSFAGEEYLRTVDERMKYKSTYLNLGILTRSSFAHNQVAHGVYAGLNLVGLVLAIALGIGHVPPVILVGLGLVLGLACLVNLFWFIALSRFDADALASWMLKTVTK